jgi:hypothetical protein
MESYNQPSGLDRTLSDLEKAGSYATSLIGATSGGSDWSEASGSSASAEKEDSNARHRLVLDVTCLEQCIKDHRAKAVEGSTVLTKHYYNPETHRLVPRETNPDGMVRWVLIAVCVIQIGIIVRYICPAMTNTGDLEEKKSSAEDQALLSDLRKAKSAEGSKAESPNVGAHEKTAAKRDAQQEQSSFLWRAFFADDL